MKTFRLALLLSITIMGSMSFTDVKAQNINVNFSVFQRELSPYGRWITNPRFGEVWIYNDANFRPYYSDGHWEYTNYGWAWVSDFDWGWAPFHYGRWEYDDYDGWMWIPGYEWGAAWVSWSSYDDYYGWAPLGYGLGVNISFGSIPYNRWTFIPRANICERNIARYYVSPNRNYGFRNAVIINNYYGDGGRNRFFRGPDRDDVQRYTHNNIQERRIEDRDRFNRWASNNDRGNNFGGRRNDGGIANNNNGQRGNGNFNGQGNNNRGNDNNFGGRRNDGGVNNNDNGQRGNGNFNGQGNNNRGNDNNFGGRRNDGGMNNNDNGQRGNGNFNGQGNNNRGNDNNFGGRRNDGGMNNNDNGQRGNNNFPGRGDNNGQRGNDNSGGRRFDNMNRQPQNNFPQQREQRPTFQQPAPETRSMERRNDGGGFNRSQGQERQGGGGNNGGNNGGGRGRRG